MKHVMLLILIEDIVVVHYGTILIVCVLERDDSRMRQFLMNLKIQNFWLLC